jgi:succinyl-diaminopimelate desuccinylase
MADAATNDAIDPVEFARDLIRCPSVTPADEGALDVLQSRLESLGFTCHRLPFSGAGTPDVDNLYARIGTQGPNFCFAGHTDVVPTGDAEGWQLDPFGAEIKDGKLYGRGASDMKGAIAAFVAAAAKHINQSDGGAAGSISLLITGDEEGPAINGTAKVLRWLEEKGETLDACVVGEPTNPTQLGEMVKIGRRGSFSAWLTVNGVQGHTAYPHLADNPIHRMVRMLEPLVDGVLDEGTEHFQGSTLAMSSVDVGNPANNVIPAKAKAAFNIRFNDLHTGESLEAWLREQFDKIGGDYDLVTSCSSNAFLTEPGPLSAAVSDAIEEVVGRRPELSTTGGTSDARFIRNHCPVVEFGIVGQTMHKVDEHVEVADIRSLAAIYEAILKRFFTTR